MKNEYSNLAKNIINSRKKLGLSQEALAEKSNISLSTIQRIEKGSVKPRAYTLKVLAESLEIDASELLSFFVENNFSTDTIVALKKVNLSAVILSFIPLINFVIPMIVWKRNKLLSSKDAIAGKISSFQLLWGIGVIIGYLLCIFLSNYISGDAGSGHYVANTFYLIAIVFNLYIILKTAAQLNQKHTNLLTFVPNLF